MSKSDYGETGSIYHGLSIARFFKFDNIFLLIIFSFLLVSQSSAKVFSLRALTYNSAIDGEISEAYASIKKLDTPPFQDSLNSLSLLPQTKPRLLPKRISFMENFLWGENGLTRKIGLVPELTPNERIHELHIRRAMLTAHQIGGFTTLALMLTTVYFGQRTIDGNRRLGDVHQAFAAATILSYSITGLLAILSPPPLIRRDEGGTVVIHKTLAWIHVAGMILTPILGSLIGGRRHFNIDKAHFHQVAGYITTAVFTASMLVITF